METNTSAIEFKDISKSYEDNTVIEGLDLTIERGEFVTIIGSSGCGKTTLMKMVNGLVQPSSGTVLVDGQDISELDQNQLRRNIGYAVQGSVLFPHMSVRENIAYVPNLLNGSDKKRTENAVRKWMDIVGLDEELLDRYPAELSGGQQQRVGIARSLAASPDILLMDEPFGAVDEITREMLQDEISRIHHDTNITILFVTHDISEALKLGTKVLVMDAGEVQQFDTPEAIVKDPKTDFVRKLVSRQQRLFGLAENQTDSR